MVRLYKQLFGRGATKARSNYAGPGTLVTTIENSLTAFRAEDDRTGRAPVGAGDTAVLPARQRGRFIGTLEKITGRKVRAFVSGMDTHRDVASEVFYFEPVPSA
jgi:uncharacterized protein YbcI